MNSYLSDIFEFNHKTKKENFVFFTSYYKNWIFQYVI